MDFDKFLEKDIVEFLDKKAQSIAEKAAGIREEEFDLYEISQDYTDEINKSLEKEDLKKAREIFEDVKNRYLKAPEGSLSKKRLYTIMEELYEKIKDYESQEQGKKSLFDTIKEYEKQGLFSRPELFREQLRQRPELITAEISKKEKLLQQIKDKKTITAQDLRQAALTYRQIKELVKNMPDNKEKQKAYDSALSWYYTIKNMKKELLNQEQKPEKKPEPKIEEKEKIMVEEELGRVRRIKQKIIESHQRIAEHIRNRDMVKSIQEYRHLKELCEEFPNKMEEEKTELLADTLSLYRSIQELEEQLKKERHLEKQEQKAEEHEQEQRSSLKKQIMQELRIIKQDLNQKKALEAVKEYKKLRTLFNQYPDQPLEEKKEVYNEIISAHKDITLLEEKLEEKSRTHQTTSKTHEIKQDVEKTHELLDQGRPREASMKLLEVKHKIHMLPKQAFDQKYKLLKQVEALEHKHLFVQNINRINSKNRIPA